MTRGRRPNIRPSRKAHIAFDEAWHARLEVFLWDETERRVPLGAYKEFFDARIREFFTQRVLDLAPFAQTLPGAAIVRGDPETIVQLEGLLKEPK